VSDPINDKELDEYLAGGSAVSRRYRELGADDVPAELDRLVVQRARAEVARPSRAQRWRRWSVPVALAASVVLVVTILIEPAMREQSVVPTEPPSAFTRTAPAAAESERQSEIARPQSETDHLKGAVGSGAAPEVVEQFARGVAPSPAPALPKATVPTPDAAQEVTVTGRRAASGDAQGSPVAAVADAPPAQVEVEASRVRAEPKYSTPPPAEAPRADAAASRESDTSHDLSEVTVTGQHRARSATGSAGPRNTIPRRASYAVEEGVAGEAASAPAAANQASASGATSHDDPVRWLDTIRQLRKDGKVREADEEWKRFRAAFPEYAVEESDPARPKH
jgi:hypothetical protein